MYMSFGVQTTHSLILVTHPRWGFSPKSLYLQSFAQSRVFEPLEMFRGDGRRCGHQVPTRHHHHNFTAIVPLHHGCQMTFDACPSQPAMINLQ